MRTVWLTTAVAACVALVVVVGCRRKDSADDDDFGEDGGASSSSGGSSSGSTGDGGFDSSKPAPELPLLPVDSKTTANLNRVWISADLSFAVAVGDDGTIVTSEDAGKTWKLSTSGVVQVKLNAVWGSGADDVWAVGVGGTILHSTNKGGLWESVSLGFDASPPTLTSIWGSSKDQFFVGSAGGDVFRSRDEGATFPKVLNVSALATDVAGIGGTSATDIWVARGFRIVHSTNGGDTWQEIAAQNIYTQFDLWAGSLQDVYTVNGNGVVRRYDSTQGEEGVLYLTKLDSALCQGCLELRGVAGIAPSDVWVVGQKGFAAHAASRDADFREAQAGSADLNGVAYVNGVVIAVGANGTIVRR